MFIRRITLTLGLAALLVGGGFGTVVAVRQAPNARLEAPVIAARQATFYIGYDPRLSCYVGEPRSVGMLITDTRTGAAVANLALPLPESTSRVRTR